MMANTFEELLEQHPEVISCLLEAVKEYYQYEENCRKFEVWYKEKHGEDFVWEPGQRGTKHLETALEIENGESVSNKGNRNGKGLRKV